ncbi:LOW QUALITY PROTEIN: hypothetical protein HID58_089044 [Brassica napus]|uniref:Amino acid transporter transmembrane domain-containing protein n=1 Tax=Brassica napus TaxID=3708 RepID=A0ABQ7XXX0_BRANA|nr:LOW QUALITY PROTEIN: hypothetical protein HID58_089044 [Brassica napus]
MREESKIKQIMNEKEDFMSEPFIVKTINDEETTLHDYQFDNNSQGNTSFSKTYFHGINALSGLLEKVQFTHVHREANGVAHILATKCNADTISHSLDLCYLFFFSVLSVPYALASGGWLSLIIFFTIAITTLHCAILIKRCMDMDPLIRSYPDIGYKAFGNTGRVVVSIFMNLELYLVATSFLILEDDNLNKLFSNVGFNFMGLEFGGKQMFIVLVALIILPSVWLDDMRILSYNNDSKIFRINGVTTSVSLYAFCYCAHPVFPTLYTSMKNKRQFSNVMVICFTICTFIYASVAILGYLMYGSNNQSQITLNLPTDKLISKVAICTTLVNPIAKFALVVTPIMDALRSRFSWFLPNKKAAGLILSTVLVASNLIVALLLPFFGDLMSLVGAFLSATASVILPYLWQILTSRVRHAGSHRYYTAWYRGCDNRNLPSGKGHFWSVLKILKVKSSLSLISVP